MNIKNLPIYYKVTCLYSIEQNILGQLLTKLKNFLMFLKILFVDRHTHVGTYIHVYVDIPF